MLIGETLNGTWPDATSCCVRTTSTGRSTEPITINGPTYYTYWASKHPASSTSPSATAASRRSRTRINKLVLIKLMTRTGGEAISSDEMK